MRRKMRSNSSCTWCAVRRWRREYERLPYEPLTQDVLGVPVRKVVIQVVAGRSIAVLVGRPYATPSCRLRGIDTYQEFVERHRRRWHTEHFELGAIRPFELGGCQAVGLALQVAYRLSVVFCNG